jgi:hypothetical protein
VSLFQTTDALRRPRLGLGVVGQPGGRGCGLRGELAGLLGAAPGVGLGGELAGGGGDGAVGVGPVREPPGGPGAGGGDARG